MGAAVETAREIGHAEARQIAQRLINSHFQNDDWARTSIPADPERDDDLLLHAYIGQQERARWKERSTAELLECTDSMLCMAIKVLQQSVKVAGEAADEWDKAPFGMKAGKLLIALAGRLKRYRPDIDAIHGVLKDSADLHRSRSADLWRDMDSAPKDGRPILIRFEHLNYQYATTDEERAQWEEICVAHWVVNGGSAGWTWHGLAGAATKWRPMPPMPFREGDAP